MDRLKELFEQVAQQEFSNIKSIALNLTEAKRIVKERLWGNWGSIETLVYLRVDKLIQKEMNQILAEQVI